MFHLENSHNGKAFVTGLHWSETRAMQKAALCTSLGVMWVMQDEEQGSLAPTSSQDLEPFSGERCRNM